jgi:hypothetical protein
MRSHTGNELPRKNILLQQIKNPTAFLLENQSKKLSSESNIRAAANFHERKLA